MILFSYYNKLLFDVINSDFRKKFLTILKKGCTIFYSQFIIGMYCKKNGGYCNV